MTTQPLTPTTPAQQLRDLAKSFYHGANSLPVDADMGVFLDGVASRLTTLEQVAVAMRSDAFKAGLAAFEATRAKVAEEATEATESEVLAELQQDPRAKGHPLFIDSDSVRFINTEAFFCHVGSPTWRRAKAAANARLRATSAS